MKNVGVSLVVIAVLCMCGTAQATIWYVHPDSTLNSIQAGIDLCSTGDTVLVGPGTYVENINFNGMAILVMSELSPETTIIDGSNPSHPDTGSVVVFVNDEDSTSVLRGFTIMNGSGTPYPGYPGNAGGGIWCYQSSPTITGNIINNNTADYGGGVQCGDNASPTIDSNTIIGNTSSESGGGIACFNYSSPTITHNIFTNNATYVGGAILCHTSSSPTISGNAISTNTADLGGGICC